MKFSLLNFDQPLSKIFDLLEEGFKRILGANKNWGSEMVAVKFQDIISLESILAKMLSMRAFEWLLSLVGCRIYGIIELKTNESRKSLVGWCIL